MGENAVGKLLSYILVSVVWSFLMPFLVLSQMDSTKETYIYSQVAEFADNCMVTGAITPEDYERFSKSIYDMGNYEIIIEHQEKMAYYRENGIAEVASVSSYNEQILDEMYTNPTEPTAYEMKNGDRLTISVSKKSKSTAERFLSFLGVDIQKSLIVNYSGQVGSTINK